MKHILLIFGLLLTFAASSHAANEGHSWGGGIMLVTPNQSDLDSVITEINTAQSIAVDKFSSGIELFVNYKYRFGNMWALMFRPSYFMQNTKGQGHKFELTGLTFFPMARMYPLENDF